MVVRDLKNGDYVTLLSLDAKCYPDDTWTLPHWRQLPADSYVLVGEQESFLGGFTVFTRDMKNNTVTVNKIAVAPGYRNQGRGSQLLKHVESLAVMVGAHRIYAVVAERDCYDSHVPLWLMKRGFNSSKCVGDTVHFAKEINTY